MQNCGYGPRGDDLPKSDSLASMCWPIVGQHKPPMTPLEMEALYRRPLQQDVAWPVAQPWKRNLQEPRCQGEGRCQGDAKICNSKYRYGVDDVGRCPSEDSCRASITCEPCPRPCPNPCPKPQECNKLTTRCFDWPIPRNERCAPENTSIDLRPPRADLNFGVQPEKCPTCKRVVVDMECGPLGYNY